MPGETFSAGTIFLQVVPVFGDVQKAITRNAKDWNNSLGDEMEKGGRKAGERAGSAMADEMEKAASESGDRSSKAYAGHFQSNLKGALRGVQRELDALQFNTLSDSAKESFDRVKRLAKDLDGEITADMDDKKVLAKLEFLRASMDTLTKGKHEVHIDANLRKLHADLDKAVAYIEAETAKTREFQIAAAFESRQAERAMGAFERRMRETAKKASGHLGDSMNREIKKIKAELEGLSGMEIGIDVTAEQAMAKLEALQQQARRLALSSPNIDVKVDAGKAEAELALLIAQVRKIDGKDINIKADVNTGAAVAKVGILQSLVGAKDGSDAAANSFRSFNAIILAAVTLLPALIPVLGAAGGALIALVPILAAVGGGIGAMVIGFSGIGNAVQALGKQADQAGKDTNQSAKTIRAASYSVQDAKQGLADAERSAGRAAADSARQVADARRAAAQSISDAIARQKEAQQAYRQSVLDVKDAEQGLRDARKQAAQDQLDLQDKIKQNQLDIRQATLDLFDATVKNNSTAADGASTNYDKEAANVAMMQAQLHIKELRDTQKQLAGDQAQQAKTGIDGSQGVKSAQDTLTKALQDQQKAQTELGKAAEAVNRARADGARRVAEAVRNQQRAEADGARNVARAQEQLRRAQESYGQALKDTGDIGAASMRNVEAAMGKLGPAGQRFALFLFGMRDAWQKFRSSIQEAMLPGVQSAMETIISKYGPRFTNFMTRMAGVVGGLFQALADSLTGPAWAQFFAVMDKLGPKMLAEFGMATIKWLEAFASIMTAAAPFAEKMSTAMLGIATSFAAWAASDAGQQAITTFMGYAAKVGPDVISFLVAFVSAAANLAVALAPWGDVVLKALTGFFNWIANMDPKTLGLIAGTIIGLAIAFQVAVGLASAVLAGQSAFGTLIGRIAFGGLALAATLIVLALRFDSVRNALKKVTGFVKDHAHAIGNIIKVVGAAVIAYKAYRGIMALVKSIQIGVAAATYGAAGATYATTAASKVAYAVTRLWTGAQWLFNAAMAANPLTLFVLALIAVVAAVVYAYFHFKKFRQVVDTVFGFIKTIISTVFHAIVGYWRNILWPVLDLIMTVIWKLWKLYFKVYIHLIKLAWHGLFTGMKWVWDNVLKPVFDAIIEKLGGKKGLKHAFQVAVDAIKSIWGTLLKIIGEPIQFVINTVLRDGLVKGFNKVAKFVGSDPMKFDGVDWKFATGGVLPGYTPGHDVHHFTSPSGGRLHLSGGEAIMRPEFTAAVSPQWVDQMNSVARAGGVGGVRRALGGGAYAKGGVFSVGADVPTTMNGMKISNIAAAQVALAKKLFGIDFRLMQGGYGGNHVAASGTSHNYPGVGDFAPGTIAAETALRKVGFAAWARNIAGRSSVGSGAHVHAASLLDPGNASDPQITGSWPSHGNGLGGANNDPAPHYPWVKNLMGQLSAIGVSDIANLSKGGGGASFPSWILGVAKNPLGYIRDLIGGPLKALGDKFGSNPLVQVIKDLPGQLVHGVGQKVLDMIPNPIKSAAGVVGNFVEGAGHAIGHAASGVGHAIGGVGHALGVGMASGGVLPYNGTMKYDAGGYLPPGLTSVVNLTGKPEPVFTDSQFSRMGGNDGSLVHYEPHFHKSDLTARDVAFDLDVEYQRLSRKSKRYGGV